jgi:UDP-N-acetyl-alpha-D-muramoyl-L-alanyl-L-glutamate epimerase
VSTAPTAPTIGRFDPTSFKTFRFVSRSLSADGQVALRYALDALEFEETYAIPRTSIEPCDPATVDGLLDLLHWVAGISYYKAAIPSVISFEGVAPGPATASLLEALYSEGLGEFAVVNCLPDLPRPRFHNPADSARVEGSAGRSRDGHSEADPSTPAGHELKRLLVPVGGGKDSAVAMEIARASGLDVTLFSVGDAPPIRETARVCGYERLTTARGIDPLLLECNAAGALNGHVPITAIVSCVALLTAALNGQDAVTLANERSASAGNLAWRGIEINHQFSKSRAAERLMAAAVAEIPGAPRIFSVLRPASELTIARAFARFEQYHPAFTSCNRVFQIDPAKRLASWCGDCDKCRFVFLILAPFMTPKQLTEIFGADLLGDDRQYEGFALLSATGGDKPFECVGEVEEVLAAIHLLASDPSWSNHPVVARLATEVLSAHLITDAAVQRQFALSDDHDLPDELMGAVRAVLGA